MSSSHCYFQFSPDGHTSCSGCAFFIPKHKLRFGRGPASTIEWHCMACVSKEEAKEFLDERESQLVVPPSASSGGDGPETAVVEKMKKYLTSLAKGRKRKALLTELEDFTMEEPSQTSLKRKNYIRSEMDSHWLDKQVLQDRNLLETFEISDLRALCLHHQLAEGGPRNTLLFRLKGYYDKALTKNPCKHRCHDKNRCGHQCCKILK